MKSTPVELCPALFFSSLYRLLSTMSNTRAPTRTPTSVLIALAAYDIADLSLKKAIHKVDYIVARNDALGLAFDDESYVNAVAEYNAAEARSSQAGAHYATVYDAHYVKRG